MELNQKLITQLQRSGLNKKAATIYAALLELGGAYPSRIAEITKINRSTTYKILDDLAFNNLINKLEKGKKIYYQINEPNKLLQYTRSKIRIANNQFEQVKKLLPDLEGLLATSGKKPKVKYFSGLDEILDLYADHVNVDQPYEQLAYSNTAGVIEFMPKKFRDKYVKKKQTIGIPSRGIVPDTAKDLDYNKIVYKGIKKSILPKLRFVPAKMFPYKNEITIYGQDKVSIVNFKESTLIGVTIQDQDIHDMMKMIFELAWAGAKKYQS